MDTFIVALITGVALGSVYALIGLGFTLVVASTTLFVFTLESVVSLGGILGYLVLNNGRLPVGVAVVIVCLAGLASGLLLDIMVHRPFIRRAHNVHRAVLMASLGIALGVDAILSLTFGVNPRQVHPYVDAAPMRFGSITVPWTYVVMVGVAAIIAVLFQYVLRRTLVGFRLTAVQQDRVGASLSGVNVALLTTGVFACAGVLSALGGFLITPISLASSATGSNLIIPTFAAMAFGGFGSFAGAVVGGLFVGLVQSIVPVYTTSNAVNPILVGVIVIVLMVRPAGLLGGQLVREF